MHVPGVRAGGVDRRHNGPGISSQRGDQPRYRRIRGHRAEHVLIGTQLRDVGQAVPAEFYEAIAEILAYVYRLSGKAKQYR